ncbi:MAG: hypothetical protein SFW65_08200 [Alphaproteobacteria bacterium]|nr:hypothetical protein [Alphaproteobacteria bacterium]
MVDTVSSAVSVSDESAFSLGHVLVIRDWSQSSYGNRIPLNHEKLDLFYDLVGQFNQAGPAKITAIEGPSGAQPQRDVMLGRPPLESIVHMDKKLPPDVEMRLLVRGPFAVGLEALHEDDLTYVLETMAQKAGAQNKGDVKGRPVVFRLFEAQNNPEEYAATLRILTAMRAKGYNVSCELAICYTADDSFTSEHYRHLFERALIAQAVDPDVISRISIKDMIGQLNDKPGEVKDGNAYSVTNVLLMIAEQFKEKYNRVLEIGIHTHQTDDALGANTMAAAAAVSHIKHNEGREAAISRLTLDSIPGGRGFADTKALMVQAAKFGYGAMPSEAQLEILDRMEGVIAKLERAYRADSNIFTGEELRYARLPGGAVPSAMVYAINPLAQSFMAKGLAETESAAMMMAARAFLDVNRRLSIDFGNASSVTPGALYLTLCSKVVIEAMLERGFFKRMKSMGLDLTKRFSQHGLLTGLLDDIRDYYDALRDMPDKRPTAYFRGQMPQEVDPRLLKHICYNYLSGLLPEAYAQSALKDVVPERSYLAVRRHLLSDPADKSKARAFLRRAKVPADKIEAFVEAHIGKAEARRDLAKKPLLAVARSAVKSVEGVTVSEEEAVFATLISGNLGMGRPTTDAVRMMCTPRTTHPYEYLDSLDVTMFSGAQRRWLEAARVQAEKYKVRSLSDLARKAPEAHAELMRARSQGWMAGLTQRAANDGEPTSIWGSATRPKTNGNGNGHVAKPADPHPGSGSN